MPSVAVAPTSGLIWTPAAKDLVPRSWRRGFEKLLMSGSLANFSSKGMFDEQFGGTAYSAPATLYFALYTAAIDDTLLGNTANEAAYTSYARLALTNNTTIFPASTGSTSISKTFPGDATKSWPASTGGTSTCTFLGILNGNAGTSADKGVAWCSITSVTINSGDTPQLAQNAVTATLD
jgi:hypothetical protein